MWLICLDVNSFDQRSRGTHCAALWHSGKVSIIRLICCAPLVLILVCYAARQLHPHKKNNLLKQSYADECAEPLD
jgi:hypothetical protein